MKREFDPRRLEMRGFAKAAGVLAGEWPAAGFERLQDALAPDAPHAPVVASDLVRWSANGTEVPVRGGASQPWLQLRADATVPLVCQRCLKPYTQALTLDQKFLFVQDEAEAAALDADAEHDVLVLSRELDLHALLEDELLLSLPLVPRHEQPCPEPLPLPAGAVEAPAEEQPHPFAALAALRRGDG